MRFISFRIPDYGKARIAAENIMELFARTPSIDNGSNNGDTIVGYYRRFAIIYIIFQLNFNGQLEFDNVHFAYPTRPETIVLNSFKLKIKAGMYFYAIVFLSTDFNGIL